MRRLACQLASVFAALAFAATALAQEEQPEIEERKYSDWTAACAELEGGSQCFAIFHASDEDDGSAFLEVRPNPGNEDVPAVATLQVPLGVWLTSGVIWQVDRKDERVSPVLYCTPDGCISQVGITKDELDDMKRGRRLNITVNSPDPDTPYKARISLRGFRRAFDQF